jgi:hypothetical protein
MCSKLGSKTQFVKVLRLACGRFFSATGKEKVVKKIAKLGIIFGSIAVVGVAGATAAPMIIPLAVNPVSNVMGFLTGGLVGTQQADCYYKEEDGRAGRYCEKDFYEMKAGFHEFGVSRVSAEAYEESKTWNYNEATGCYEKPAFDDDGNPIYGSFADQQAGIQAMSMRCGDTTNYNENIASTLTQEEAEVFNKCFNHRIKEIIDSNFTAVGYGDNQCWEEATDKVFPKRYKIEEEE